MKKNSHLPMTLILLTGSLLLTRCGAQHEAQHTVSLRPIDRPLTGTWGDQGDGTYRNPVLNSNYPDSDVEAFEGKWYMISSKGRYMKGMTVLESEDLVNWSIIGGVVDSVDWYGDAEPEGRGVWAGDLVRHNNRWYCYFIDIDKGLFVSTSKDIAGPWEHPMLMLEQEGMTDPTVYFDENSRKGYLLCNYKVTGEEDGHRYYNRLFRLSWDGMQLLNEGKDVYVESGAEAAKIYHVGQYYYLFFSEWTRDEQGRKDDRRQVVLRSKTIDGPYEKKVLLERDPLTQRSSCQGALIQVPDGSWWYLHQLVQRRNTYEGRPQCLIPVRWEDDWPVLGEDPDGNGIGNTVWSGQKPVQGKAIRAPQTDDDFNAAELSPQWLWDGNPVAHLWSLEASPGHLRLYGADPRSGGPEPVEARPEDQLFQGLPSKILQRKMGKEKDTITTRMNFSAMGAGQSAGLLIEGYNFGAAGIEQDTSGKPNLYVEFANGKTSTTALTGAEGWVYLRAILDKRKLHFSYSLDGMEFKHIGNEYTLETRGFNGLFIGLFNKNDQAGAEGYADFDWFSYRYDGPKSQALSGIEISH